MSDFDFYKVNLNTPQPGGRQGESPRAAFTKYNDFLSALNGFVDQVSATEPGIRRPFSTWVDISVDPPLLKRRNADNTAWVTIGPALRMLGTASALDVPSGQTAFGTASARSATSSKTDGTLGRIPVLGNMAQLSNADKAITGDVMAYIDSLINVSGLLDNNFTPASPNGPGQYSYFLRLGLAGLINSCTLALPYLRDSGAIKYRAVQAEATGGQWIELFDTRNCKVITNASGIAVQFANGYQYNHSYQVINGDDLSWLAIGTGSYTTIGGTNGFTAPFVATPQLISKDAIDGSTYRGVYCTYVGEPLTTHVSAGTVLRSTEPPIAGGTILLRMTHYGRYK